MITGLRLNKDTKENISTIDSKLKGNIIIKTFDDKNDPEIKFYKLANRLGKDQIVDNSEIKADPVFKKLLGWMPEYHGVFDINKLESQLDEESYEKVKAMKDVPKAFLIIEDITYKDSINKIDLKMGTRRFDSSAIAKHLKCKPHKDKGKTKLQTQTDKRDKNKMIKKWGVNIVAGKAPWVGECLNKSDEFITCIMGGKDYKEKTYEDVKRSLLDIFLPESLLTTFAGCLKKINLMFKINLRKYGLHFFSSSLFITLDKDRKRMKIKMIDFAHVEAKEGNEFGLPTFRPETDANKKCKGKTPDLLNNEKNTFDIGYMKGLNTLLKMIEEKKKELKAERKTKRSGDGYKIKF
jgi:hypothetical protein